MADVAEGNRRGVKGGEVMGWLILSATLAALFVGLFAYAVSLLNEDDD